MEMSSSLLTNRRRFASGWDLVYCARFPLGIHSERMRKQCRSVDTETPNRGITFGWDKCFHPITSRQKRWWNGWQ